MTLAYYQRRRIGSARSCFRAKYGSVPSGTSRSYKYKNQDTGLRLRNTVEINKTTTSLTTVDWGIQRENNNNSVQSCINRANIKSTLPNQRISIHCRIKSCYGTKGNLSRGKRPRQYVSEPKTTQIAVGQGIINDYNDTTSYNLKKVGVWG